jgi:hypothetical protein
MIWKGIIILIDIILLNYYMINIIWSSSNYFTVYTYFARVLTVYAISRTLYTNIQSYLHSHTWLPTLTYMATYSNIHDYMATYNTIHGYLIYSHVLELLLRSTLILKARTRTTSTVYTNIHSYLHSHTWLPTLTYMATSLHLFRTRVNCIRYISYTLH